MKKEAYIMITNHHISLAKDSQIRIDALNTIKYTLLLNYQVPKFKNDDSFIYEVLTHCQKCCKGLFTDSAYYYYDFFGRNWDIYTSNNKTNPIYALYKIGQISREDNAQKESNTQNKLEDIKNSIFKPYLHNMILQDCIMSFYHAILTELKTAEYNSLYKVLNNKHLTYQKEIRHQPATNKQKSSKAADFGRISQTHLNSLPFMREMIFKEENINVKCKEVRINEHFSELWYNICQTNSSKFKNIFFPKAINKTSQRQMLNKLINVVGLHKELTPTYIYEEKRFASDPVKSLYQMYLVERIFNLRMFYSVYKALCYVNTNTGYRLDQNHLISTLSLSASLPNVFSRQSLLMYALIHIGDNIHSTQDFWVSHDISKYDTFGTTTRKDKKDFDFNRWKNQLTLFINYLSKFIIPIYQWCFINMMLESIEEEYPNETHEDHLNKIKEILEAFIRENYNSLLQPFSLDQYNKISADSLSVIKPIDNVYVADNVSYDFFDKLFRKFFDKSKDFDLNLSTNLNPNYFKNNVRNLPNQPTKFIRDFYIELLRYNYWEEFDTYK